jgi:acyl carrier protein
VLRDQLRVFIIDQLMMGMDVESLNDSGSLMDMGILDSVGVLDLVGFLEQTWSIDIDDEELVRENLDSLDNLVGFVERKVA